MSGIGGYGVKRSPRKCWDEECHSPVRERGLDGKWRETAFCAYCGRPIRNIGDEGRDLWVIDRERERRA
jgi:hypothetical protein